MVIPKPAKKIVRSAMENARIQEIGLKREGEQLYGRMMEATTRGLSSSSGGQYRRVWQRWLQWKEE